MLSSLPESQNFSAPSVQGFFLYCASVHQVLFALLLHPSKSLSCLISAKNCSLFSQFQENIWVFWGKLRFQPFFTWFAYLFCFSEQTIVFNNLQSPVFLNSNICQSYRNRYHYLYQNPGQEHLLRIFPHFSTLFWVRCFLAYLIIILLKIYDDPLCIHYLKGIWYISGFWKFGIIYLKSGSLKWHLRRVPYCSRAWMSVVFYLLNIWYYYNCNNPKLSEKMYLGANILRNYSPCFRK